MTFITPRSKCLPQTEHCTQTNGLLNKSYNNQSRKQEIIQISASASNTTFNQIPTWIKADHLLSEVDSLNRSQITQMTKTMDSFLDAWNNTTTQNSTHGLSDELMTPTIDPGFGTKNQNISTWIDSSHAQLNINKEDDYIGFDESAIALPILLNSPPNSIKSNSSHDETDSCNAFFANEPEESFNFVDPFQPIKNSQDDLYGGPVAFHTEIETVSRNQIFNITTTNNNRSDNEKDIFMGMETPIIGNDLMIGREICGFNFKQIKSETPDMKVNINETMNGNTVPMQSVQKKLLARRTMNRPQIQLNIKIEPVLSIDNEPMLQEKVTNSNVITTPQITKEILELENDFDLVDYIVEDDKHTQSVNTVEKIHSKPNVEETVSVSDIEQILPTPAASPHNKQTESNISDIEIDTVSTRSVRATKRSAAKRKIDFSEISPKRPRGRPPKTEPTVLSPSVIKKLNPVDRKYMEMRLKNNEASRRSRLTKKGKEEALQDELNFHISINERLKQRDRTMDTEIKKWTKVLMKLATRS